MALLVILFEDDHLLVINKPAGLNTHAPSPFAGEGVYDWLRHREPRWASLAIIHRLDKETSGLLLFGKTPEANRSLTDQFTRHAIHKRYLLLTDRTVKRTEFTASSTLVRTGEKYMSRPLQAGGVRAETRFRVLRSGSRWTALIAEPVTGRTHQIRVHAAEHGFPVLGDTLYGGSSAPRLCLHAEEITFRHPMTGAEISFRAPADFTVFPHAALRESLIDPEMTTAYRILHGASDGWPGWYVDRLGDFLLSQSEYPLTEKQTLFLEQLLTPHSRRREQADSAGTTEIRLLTSAAAPGHHASRTTLRGAYHKTLQRTLRGATTATACPQHVLGEAAPERFLVCENGLQFELSFSEGYSVGLFLDQRDNRHRFLHNHIAAGFPLFLGPPSSAEVLNLFAYTCGFSVCAAKAGAKTTSIDLSRKYLEWGKQNFSENQIDPGKHEFIYGDAFDWVRRLGKKQRTFNVIVLDPPTFSRSKERGAFQIEKDYGELLLASLSLLKADGALFASTNSATWEPEKFVAMVSAAVQSGGRQIVQQHYVPQPPDFPISRMEPSYLKTLWLRLR